MVKTQAGKRTHKTTARKPMALHPSQQNQQTIETRSLLSRLLQIGSTYDPALLFDLIVDEAPRLVGAREGSIFWRDGRWRDNYRNNNPGPPNGFFRRATHSAKRDTIGIDVYEPGRGLTGWVALHGRTVRIDDISNPEGYKDRYPGIEWADAAGGFKNSKGKDYQRAFLAVPVYVDEKVAGVIRIARTLEPKGVFSKDDELLLGTFAQHIGSIVRRAEEAELGKLWEELYQSGVGIRGIAIDSYLQQVADKIPQFLGAQACSIFIPEVGIDGHVIRLRATTKDGPLAAKVGKAIYKFGQGLTGWVARELKTLCISDVDDEHEVGRYSGLKHVGLHEEWKVPHSSFLACPVHINDCLFAVVRLAQERRGLGFSPSDVRNLESFCKNLAVLLQHVELFRHAESEKHDAERRLDKLRNIIGELPITLRETLNDIQAWLHRSFDVPAGQPKQFGPILVEQQRLIDTRVFVAMPFRDYYHDMFEFAIRPAVHDVGMDTWIASNEPRAIDIMRKVYEGIQSSKCAIVDISDWNANVLFELGILYELGRPVLLLKKHDATVPADLAGIEYIPYGGFAKLRSDLVTYLKSLQAKF